MPHYSICFFSCFFFVISLYLGAQGDQYCGRRCFAVVVVTAFNGILLPNGIQRTRGVPALILDPREIPGTAAVPGVDCRRCVVTSYYTTNDEPDNDVVYIYTYSAT